MTTSAQNIPQPRVRHELKSLCRIWAGTTLLGDIRRDGPTNYCPTRADGTPVREPNHSRIRRRRRGWPDERSALAALLCATGHSHVDVTAERAWKVLVHEEELGEVYRLERDRTFFFGARDRDGTQLSPSCSLPGWTTKEAAAAVLVAHYYPHAIRTIVAA